MEIEGLAQVLCPINQRHFQCLTRGSQYQNLHAMVSGPDQIGAHISIFLTFVLQRLPEFRYYASHLVGMPQTQRVLEQRLPPYPQGHGLCNATKAINNLA